MKKKKCLPQIPHALNSTVLDRNLGRLDIDTTQLHGLAAGQLIHGPLANVEARGGVVDSQDVDALAVVLQVPAGTARGGVPAGDGGGTANVGEVRDLALGVPAVLGDEPVDAVGAGEGGERASGLVVAGVVGDCRGEC